MISTAPDERLPLVARWTHNGVVLTANGTIEFTRQTVTGTEWWNGSGWQALAFTYTLAYEAASGAHTYALVVPAQWMGQVVRFICRYTSKPSLIDLLRVDATVASRAAASDIATDIGKVS
jgi:hypothetical protein